MGECFAAVIWGVAPPEEFPVEGGMKFGSWVDNWDDFLATCPPELENLSFESSSPDCDEKWMGIVALRMQLDSVCWTMLELQPKISQARRLWGVLRDHVQEHLDVRLPEGQMLIVFDHT